MIKIIVIVLIVNLVNAFLVRRQAKKKGLNGNEWFLLSIFLFVLAWVALSKQREEAVFSKTEKLTPPLSPPPQPSPSAPKPLVGSPTAPTSGGGPPPAPLTPLPKPQEQETVSLSQFKPKSEITSEDYAASRKKK